MIYQIYNELKEATPLKLVSVVSDFATILGVSIATLIAGPFLGNVSGMGFDAAEFLWAVFFYFIFIIVFLSGFVGLIKDVIDQFRKKNISRCLISSVGFLLFISISLTLTPILNTFFGTISGSRYMLPPRPAQVEAVFENVRLDITNEVNSIKGHVTFSKVASPLDYTVALYIQNGKTGEYEYEYIGNYKSDAPLNSDGKFSLPNVKKYETQTGYLVLFLSADKGRGIGSVFPNRLTQIPSSSQNQLGVVVYQMPNP